MVFAFEDDFGCAEPEFDRRVRIGKEQYNFFFPIEIEEFVVNIWTRNERATLDSSLWKEMESTDQGAIAPRYCVQIYWNGRMLTSKDRLVRKWNWSSMLDKSWSEEKFTKAQVEEILADLNSA